MPIIMAAENILAGVNKMMRVLPKLIVRTTRLLGTDDSRRLGHINGPNGHICGKRGLQREFSSTDLLNYCSPHGPIKRSRQFGSSEVHHLG